jgi:hypothetical protein
MRMALWLNRLEDIPCTQCSFHDLEGDLKKVSDVFIIGCRSVFPFRRDSSLQVVLVPSTCPWINHYKHHWKRNLHLLVTL